MDKLLISTILRFVYFDGVEPHILHESGFDRGNAHYTGMTWDDKGILYLSGAIDTRYVIHRFVVSDMRELDPLLNDLHETHQIFWMDGLLYVTNTGLNRVEIFDGKDWRYKAWNLYPCDVDHINGIWSDGQYIYVSEHRQKVIGGSRVRTCALGSLDSLDIMHVGPDIHNVYIENGITYSLTSYDKDTGTCPAVLAMRRYDKVVSVDRIDKPGWGRCLLRGLARTHDYWYVGVSRWEEDRSKRHVGDAVIVQLDEHFMEVDRLVLRDYGPVCDMRVVGAEDLAHNGIILEDIACG